MLEQAKAAAGLNTKVVAVTVLTSLDTPDLHDIGAGGTPPDPAARPAPPANDAGIHGILVPRPGVQVTPGARPGALLVVPGARPVNVQAGPHHRTHHPPPPT